MQNTIPSSTSAPMSVSQARGVWSQSGSGWGAEGDAAADVLAVKDAFAVAVFRWNLPGDGESTAAETPAPGTITL